eukprot:7915479-Pyramimonas_sp.AAC.1
MRYASGLSIPHPKTVPSSTEPPTRSPPPRHSTIQFSRQLFTDAVLPVASPTTLRFHLAANYGSTGLQVYRSTELRVYGSPASIPPPMSSGSTVAMKLWCGC